MLQFIRAPNFWNVYVRRYQQFCTLMADSLRELRTAVREWECCKFTYLMTNSTDPDKLALLNDKLCRFRSVGFFRSQLIWIYTVCKGGVYPEVQLGKSRSVCAPTKLIQDLHFLPGRKLNTLQSKREANGQIVHRLHTCTDLGFEICVMVLSDASEVVGGINVHGFHE